MITPALVIVLMIIGWSGAAFAMLWGMLRIARYHHKPNNQAQRDPRSEPDSSRHSIRISLNA